MDSGGKSGKELTHAFVRAQLDEILAAEITSLIEIDADLLVLSYNVATLSCILLAVEREREIKTFKDSPPERYTHESFLEELYEIGLEQDMGLSRAIDSVIEKGYLSENGNGEIRAEVSAYTMVGFLDTIFPGMQGMNLIAFVMQMNDEVVSGRKSLEDAKASFAQTLKSRGVAVSRKKAEQKATELASEKSGDFQTKDVSRRLKEANALRSSSLKMKRTLQKPTVYSSDGHEAGRVTIKTLFDKGSSTEDLVTEKAMLEARAKAEELARLEERIQEAEKKTREIELREQELKAAQETLRLAEEKAALIRQREQEMAAREVELRAMEAKLRAEAKEQETIETEDEDTDTDDDIESRIAAFEAELAMPCPLCGKGQVVSEKTSKNKDYFTCTNTECRFVSWEKPYHFSCPLCRNPFLIEMTTPSGGKGLKCPRASCSFTQDSLADPSQVRAGAPGAPVRRKKLVRRVKRRS
ncbi:MAG: DNA topoisomerase I [Pseudomonadota bacterium]